MKKYHVHLSFTQPVLGTISRDPEVYKNYIAGKAALTDEALAEELETVEKIEEKGWTGFHKVDGLPIIYDYVIKGFFKDVCGMLKRANNTQSSKLTAHKKIIDGLIFVQPRRIPLVLPTDAKIGVLERPLRAQTAQGERITLARSDTAPENTTLDFDILVMGVITENVLREWFDYGQYRGLGQWRNGGYGTFEYELSEVK
jgi:hypothetical protein